MTEPVRAPLRRQREWYSAPAFAHIKAITVYLVDAPISFGHSQLVVDLSEDRPEEDVFAIVAHHIAKCVRALREVLPKVIWSYGQLTDYTDTTGSYLKTAILRASTNEDRLQYKVHLVPLFGSHLEDIKLLHQKTQHLESPTAGGMLHWLGEREAIVDHDARDRNSRAYHERVASFRLDALARDCSQEGVQFSTRYFNRLEADLGAAALWARLGRSG